MLTFMVVEPEPLTELGLKLARAPDGSPDPSCANSWTRLVPAPIPSTWNEGVIASAMVITAGSALFTEKSSVKGGLPEPALAVTVSFPPTATGATPEGPSRPSENFEPEKKRPPGV